MNELTKRHVKAAFLEASGKKAVEIAEGLGVTPQTISNYRRLDEYNVLVSKILNATLRASQMRLIEGSHKAVDTIIKAMDSDKENIRLRASESLLKMVGMVEVKGDIGATTIAELKTGDCLLDLGDMKIVHQNIDKYLDQIGTS